MRLKRKPLGVLCTLALLYPLNTAAEQNPSLESMMTSEEYRAAGLDKLTEAERKALLEWINSRDASSGSATATATTVAPAGGSANGGKTDTVAEQEMAVEQARDEDNFGFPEPLPDYEDKSNRLYANIMGDFRGWSGKTVFILDNGQVWRQRVSGRYTYLGDDRRVEITQNNWGFYEMKLLAADRTVGVSRVK